ncbi:cob(I)alamin adenosyltransferase [Bhargavaea ginsengi]|uniref:Corrinoid adenosyltransferase n=1 Tax=Bhargavaea ginsengi TaxID=426757 RepID=A0A1H7AR60_9BACL|nr:cob(I)yrinic acid a,c-diamide adenosyltransferase [Bhargavaea ginsengi]SEJ68079.1 cob(I)alamin adenosyltransferase [Bhargavaea ginsengi]
MKIYTRTGDKGQTSLIYGKRVPKTDPLVEAYGTCDEANSAIGLGLSHLHQEFFDGKDELMAAFHQIQTVLFHVGAELATPEGKEVKWKLEKPEIEKLEQWIDRYDGELPPLKNFILPGGHPAAAGLHYARTVVRRAERASLLVGDHVNSDVLAYLNRLSDFLFVAARYINMKLGRSEDVLHAE